MNDTRLAQIRALMDAADRLAAELRDETSECQPSLRWHLDNMRGYLRRVANKTRQLERLP